MTKMIIKLIKIALIGGAILYFFTGCAGKLRERPILNEPTIKEKKDGRIEIRQNTNNRSFELEGISSSYKKSEKEKNVLLKSVFDIAAKKTLEKGYKEFALVYKKFNNLQGFPINTINGINQYCDMQYIICRREGFSRYASAGRYMNITILPVKDLPYTIPVFNAEAVLKEDIKENF